MNYTPNSRFANYVTNIAFHLSLSRGMCAYLLAIIDEAKVRTPENFWEDLHTGGFRDFVSTGRSLESRGLIVRKDYNIGNRVFSGWVPTEEGILVGELVRRSVAANTILPTKAVSA